MAYGGRGGRWFMEPASPLSVLELIKAGNLDLRLAALLWVIMEWRASMVVAAGPSRAGKTTTLNMLLDFLNPDIRQIELRGYEEDFGFLKSTRPADTYLVAAEFSDYGAYVWGDVALKAFELLTRGYGLAGTMHAQTAKEVIGILNQYLGLPAETLVHIDVIVTLKVTAGRLYGSEPVRRIHAVTLVMPHEKGIALEVIASLKSGGSGFDIADDEALETSLAEKLKIEKGSLARDMKERQKFLEKLQEEAKISRDEVRQAIEDFYNSRKS